MYIGYTNLFESKYTQLIYFTMESLRDYNNVLQHTYNFDITLFHVVRCLDSKSKVGGANMTSWVC